MNKAWPKTPLGEVLVERREIPSDNDLLSGRVRIVEKIGFNEGRIQFRAGGSTKTGMILVQPGDLVVSGINAAKGAIAIYDESNTEPVAATIHYGAYVPDRKRVDINFLWWLLRSLFFRELLLEHVPGGIKTELKAKRLLPIPVPLPSLSEQQRIVARIEELASKISGVRMLRAQNIETVEALLHAGLRSIRCELQRSLYPKAALGSITKVTAGGTPSRENSAYWNGTIPWIKTGELLDGDISSSAEFITQEGVDNCSTKLFPKETVLIALYGQGQTRGRTGRLLIPAATNQACCAILPNPEKFEARYIQYWLRSLYIELREESQGGAQPNWSGGMIKGLEIVLPLLSEQRSIVAELDALQLQISTQKQLQAESAAELDALLPAILDRAFKGEL